MMAGNSKVTSWQRLRALQEGIARKGFVRVIEAHSGLSGIIGENARVEKDGEVIDYDGLWESSLTDSASKGLPDASIIGYESRMHTIDEILNVTTKPLIVDGDTGGEPAQFEYLIKHLERRGVSAVIIEDKVFPKRNSLDASASQVLEDPTTFANKIRAGKEATVTDDFMIIARLESLIAGTGLQDALERAEEYILAGTDGIMIHSGQKAPDTVMAFAAAYEGLCHRLGRRPVLVCVPTTYNSITDAELAAGGFNIIIHANHLLRAAYKAMTEVARMILISGRSLEVDAHCATVKDVFSSVGFDRITEKDRERSATRRLSVIIPAAGQDPLFPDEPKSLIALGGRHVIDFQLEVIRKVGLNRVVVIRGHEGQQFNSEHSGEGIIFCENPLYRKTFDLYSLFQAEEYMRDGFVLIYSDILFDYQILQRLINTHKDIVLAVDNSYRYHKHQFDKKLDLAVSKHKRTLHPRSLHPTTLTEISCLGKNIEIDTADYEFIGMAYFSQRGVELLREKYHECRQTVRGRFHDARSFERASLTDLLQELIDQGIPVHGLEIHKGWLEIHNQHDVTIAEKEIVPLLAQHTSIRGSA